MIDSFDYKEPQCSICGGKEFYNPKSDAPKGRIPVDRIIAKVDACFNKNDYIEAGRLLEFWLLEAISMKDLMGELSIQNELVGFYRKINDSVRGLKSITRALELIEILEQDKMTSAGTILLNCATAYKAFNIPEKAIILYKKAEIIYKDTLVKTDERFGGLYNNMALTLVDLGEYEKALNCYTSAINVMEKIADRQSDLAITYINLAHLYDNLGNKNSITDCLFKAYELLNCVTLEKNGYYAYVCEKCAPSYAYFGYDIIANELNTLAGEIYERS